MEMYFVLFGCFAVPVFGLRNEKRTAVLSGQLRDEGRLVGAAQNDNAQCRDAGSLCQGRSAGGECVSVLEGTLGIRGVCRLEHPGLWKILLCFLFTKHKNG